MSDINNIMTAYRQAKVYKAFQNGSKEVQNNNSYKALQPAIEAYKKSYKMSKKLGVK